MSHKKKDLDAAWAAVCEIHKQHLQKHGIKLPDKKSYKWVWLAVLYHNKPEYVHKNDISDAVRRVFPEAAPDQQVRHLKRDGWNLESERGYHKIDDWYNPSSEFINDQARRKGRLSAENFEDLKSVYDSKCATCGAPEGKPHPRYGDDKVELQQGHMDPEGPANDVGNLIPQCQFCNRAYKNDFTFDDKGRVRAIASIEPVKRASEKVQKEVREWADRDSD